MSPTASYGSYAVGVFLVIWLVVGLRSYWRTRQGRGRGKAMAALCDKRGMWPVDGTGSHFRPMSLPVDNRATYKNTFATPDWSLWVSDVEDGTINSITDTRNDWTLMMFSVSGLDLPYVAVTRKGDVQTLGGNGQPVHFESIDFENRFSVRADDRRMAVMLIDQGMMQWLLDLDRVNFQISGPLVSAFVRRRNPASPVPAELELLFQLHDGFAAHVPGIVHSET